MATIVREGRPDTQPSVPIAIPATLTAAASSARHRVALLNEPLPRPTVPVAKPAGLQTPAPVEPYTLALLVADIFGANANPQVVRTRNASRTRLQRLLVGVLGARRAVSKRASAVAGGLVATLLALAGVVAVQLGVNAALAATLSSAGADPTTGFVTGIARTLLGGSPFQLLALANALPLLLVGAPAGSNVQFTAPLTSLALIPALALLLGGALAGSSDFSRRARYSVARGALVGPVYAVLLTVLTVLAGGHVDGAPFDLHGGVTLIANPQIALFYGCLWGGLWGAAGGWLQLHGWRSVRLARGTLARLRFRRVIGACVGAAYGLSTGLVASLVVAVAGVVYVIASGQTPQQLSAVGQALHLDGTPQGILGLALLALLLAPSLVIWTFAAMSGLPLGLDRITYAPPAGGPGSDFLSLGLSPLWGATQTPGHPAWYLLALIPLICYFLGGRVAARFARVNGRRAAFVAGALTAIPLALGTLLLCSFASLSLQAMVPAGVLIASAGPATLPGLALVFVVGAIVAGLGGCSAGSRKRSAAERK